MMQLLTTPERIYSHGDDVHLGLAGVPPRKWLPVGI
jgi:hypothetical protein